MAENTTILFVPGASQLPDLFNTVAQRLEAANYKTDKVYLPSNGHGKHGNFTDDVIAIRSKLEPLLNAGQRIIVFVHAYGGVPACEAIKGQDMDTRDEAGLPGGVAHIFFCCSFLIPEGKSLLSAFGGRDMPWYEVSEDRQEVRARDPARVFYNDCDEEQIKSAAALLVPHAYETFHSKCTYAAWKDVPSTYLYCTRNQAIPLVLQKLMVEETAKGYGVRTEVLDASHSPFISRPEETALAIRRAAGEKV